MGGNPERAERTILPSQVGRIGRTPPPCVPRTKDASSLSGKRDGATSDTTTMGVTCTAAVGTADDATLADRDDGTAAVNSVRGAARYAAGTTTNEYDDATTAVWHAESVRENLLMGRGGF